MSESSGFHCTLKFKSMSAGLQASIIGLEDKFPEADISVKRDDSQDVQVEVCVPEDSYSIGSLDEGFEAVKAMAKQASQPCVFYYTNEEGDDVDFIGPDEPSIQALKVGYAIKNAVYALAEVMEDTQLVRALIETLVKHHKPKLPEPIYE